MTERDSDVNRPKERLQPKQATIALGMRISSITETIEGLSSRSLIEELAGILSTCMSDFLAQP